MPKISYRSKWLSGLLGHLHLDSHKNHRRNTSKLKSSLPWSHLLFLLHFSLLVSGTLHPPCCPCQKLGVSLQLHSNACYHRHQILKVPLCSHLWSLSCPSQPRLHSLPRLSSFHLLSTVILLQHNLIKSLSV